MKRGGGVVQTLLLALLLATASAATAPGSLYEPFLYEVPREWWLDGAAKCDGREYVRQLEAGLASERERAWPPKAPADGHAAMREMLGTRAVVYFEFGWSMFSNAAPAAVFEAARAVERAAGERVRVFFAATENWYLRPPLDGWWPHDFGGKYRAPAAHLAPGGETVAWTTNILRGEAPLLPPQH